MRDVETRVRDAYAGLDPTPGLADSLFEAIEDSRIAVPRPPRRWPVVVAGAAMAAVFLLIFGLAYAYGRSRAKGGGGEVDPTAVAAPEDDEKRIEDERAADQKAYDEASAGLKKDHPGAWVVLALGKVQGIGASRAEVSAAAPAARHRFVFRVGDEGNREEFVSQWYGPRFAGPGLAAALGLDWEVDPSQGIRLVKAGKDWGPIGVPPFPRVPVEVQGDGGVVGKRSVRLSVDVFLGSVGPPLMLMPEDWKALALARFEVPGSMTVLGLPCRMAAVEVSLPALGATAEVVAACPAFARERLVALARGRDAFWEWGESLIPLVTSGHEGKTVVFAADRVVGEGADAAQALRAAAGRPDGAYHRYVLAIPRGAPVSFDAAAFTVESRRRLNGTDVTVRGDGKGACLATRKTADLLGLAMAEDGRDVTLLRNGLARPARGGYAWEGSEPDPRSQTSPGVAYVVYETAGD